MDLILLLVQSFWFVAPAYAANAFPPLMRGKRPIDGGRNFRGKRLFGDGKTIEGTIGGIVFGIFIGLIQLYFQPMIPSVIDGVVLNLPVLTIPIVVLLSIGALCGDIFGSFIKRRSGIKRGGSAPLLDQLGFLIFAFIFVSLAYSIDLYVVVVLIILTPIIHLIANIIGYFAKLKHQPW
jgi:CDP-2,3-bis-(O-geranylgeranyl)-sn-glycerol synthase